MEAVSALSCADVAVEVAGRRLVEALNLSVTAGEFVAVLGENGAGKTLTLHTLAGLRPPARGALQVLDREISGWPRRALAQRLGLLTQASEDPFPSTVLETALMGRHPHIDSWRWEGEDDLRFARASLQAMDLAGREARDVQTLSGGERRRLAIATVLAQDPLIYLLDEPTNHLDPHHQLEVLRLFRDRTERGRTVLATLHDATLAAQFAHRALLLFGNGEWLYGATEQVLTATNLSRLYRTAIDQLSHRGRRVFINA